MARLLFTLLAGCAVVADASAVPPNIVWIVVEDASPHIGCYGETVIKTPAIDQLADGGIRFTRAYVTSPVCSSSRSAMVTGMYPMTLGAHNHRSQRTSGKGAGNTLYYSSYQLPNEVPLISQLLAEAGYYVTNIRKTDYNFVPAGEAYHGADWKQASPAQPIFAQFQLRGGKNRRASQYADPKEVVLPPYYPDDPVVRQDWAKYLDSWVQTDKEVAGILADLDAAGRLENAAVFLWTDHGVSHLRGKQFLYEEGIRVPLVVQLPGKAQAGTVRDDLIEHIDVAATSLALAGQAIPESMQGCDFLASDFTPRTFLFTGRDRCDETVDIIRSTCDGRYKYIRNFMSHVSHAQPNQYKDGKRIVQRMRRLHAQGKLADAAARLFAPQRPPEELYDLQTDPHELSNLANLPHHARRLNELREVLYQRMIDERDMGLIPEPILEDMGRAAGTKYHALLGGSRPEQTRRLISVITAGESGDEQALVEFSGSPDPSTRYWAAVWLGVHCSSPQTLETMTGDQTPAVRVAATHALVKLGRPEHLKQLVDHIRDPNLLVGMFALRAIEELGDQGRDYQAEIAKAIDGPFDFSRRIARRLVGKWQ